MEPRMVQNVGQPVGVQVHAVDVPVRFTDDGLTQMVANETIDPQDEQFLHELSLISGSEIEAPRLNTKAHLKVASVQFGAIDQHAANQQPDTIAAVHEQLPIRYVQTGGRIRVPCQLT